jgi:putative transcriptional regulator
MLIAMPAMLNDRFARSLIYVCAHSSEGAIGIVVNHPAPDINFSDLLVKLDVIPAADVIQLPSRAGVVKVMRGGPVETERGFVLHSADFFIENSTLPIDDGICITATLDILKAIARGDGPASAILALAMPAGLPVNSKARSRETAGCTVRQIPTSSLAPISAANTGRR